MIAVCVCVRFAIAGHMTNMRFHYYLISAGSNLFGIPQRGCPSDPRFLSALLALVRHQMPPVLKPPVASPDACVSHGGPQKRPARNDKVDGYVGARQPVLKRPTASLDACTSHGRLQKRPAGNDKVDRYAGVRNQVLQWRLEHEGRFPNARSTDEVEQALGKAWSYNPAPFKIFDAASRQLLENAEGRQSLENLTRSQREGRLKLEKAAEEKATESYKSWSYRRDTEPRGVPLLQRRNGRAARFIATTPYPFFTNVGHTCFINAVIRCLFHSGQARKYLTQAPPGNALTDVLASWLDEYSHGIAVDGAADRVGWNIMVPHKLVDIVEAASCDLVTGLTKFRYGPQHDAAEFVALVLGSTGLGTAVCAVSHPSAAAAPHPIRDESLLLVPEFEPGSPAYILASADVIHLPTLLSVVLTAEEMKLRNVPGLLAIRLPQCLEPPNAECDKEWVQGDLDESRVRLATWGEGVVDLGACCAEGIDESKALYKVKSFVQYCNKGLVPTAVIASEGHFVSYFQEGGVWYEADDLDRDSRVQILSEPPAHYPYVCFLELIVEGGAAPETLPASRCTPGGASPDGEVDEDGDETPPSTAGDAEKTEGGPPKKRLKMKRVDERSREGRGQVQVRADLRKRERDVTRLSTAGPRNDNTDSSRQDTCADAANPVQAHLREKTGWLEAEHLRLYAGDVFLLLQLLDDSVNKNEAYQAYQCFYFYIGADAFDKFWAEYLGVDADSRAACVQARLQEALGVDDACISSVSAALQAKVAFRDVLEAIDQTLAVPGPLQASRTSSLPRSDDHSQKGGLCKDSVNFCRPGGSCIEMVCSFVSVDLCPYNTNAFSGEGVGRANGSDSFASAVQLTCMHSMSHDIITYLGDSQRCGKDPQQQAVRSRAAGRTGCNDTTLAEVQQEGRPHALPLLQNV